MKKLVHVILVLTSHFPFLGIRVPCRNKASKYVLYILYLTGPDIITYLNWLKFESGRAIRGKDCSVIGSYSQTHFVGWLV